MQHAQILDLEKNITETFRRPPPVSASIIGDGGCAFVGPEDGETPGRPRFCGAPARPGSAYCRHHHGLCAVSPASAAGARTIRALEREARRAPSLPPELAYLASIAVPELDSADEPRDLAGCLDLGPRRAAVDE